MNTPTTLTQERILATEIPGPRSQALHARKVAAVSAGVGTTLPGLRRAGRRRHPASTSTATS